MDPSISVKCKKCKAVRKSTCVKCKKVFSGEGQKSQKCRFHPKGRKRTRKKSGMVVHRYTYEYLCCKQEQREKVNTSGPESKVTIQKLAVPCHSEDSHTWKTAVYQHVIRWYNEEYDMECEIEEDAEEKEDEPTELCRGEHDWEDFDGEIREYERDQYSEWKFY